MSKIKAVFFDRDNTLTCKNPETIQKYYNLVEKVSGKPYFEDKKKMFDIFKQIKEKGFNTNSYENEILFYKEYYRQVLTNECGYKSEQIEIMAEQIFNVMWLKDRLLFEDVISTFEEIKKKGLKIGIISDTTHSLKNTLVALGLDKYIDSYTCSKEIGVMKPEPEIYLAALKKLNVLPEECLYVDDYEEEVIGAENLGIKSFRIKREISDEKYEHDIQTLKEILNYL